MALGPGQPASPAPARRPPRIRVVGGCAQTHLVPSLQHGAQRGRGRPPASQRLSRRTAPAARVWPCSLLVSALLPPAHDTKQKQPSHLHCAARSQTYPERALSSGGGCLADVWLARHFCAARLIMRTVCVTEMSPDAHNHVLEFESPPHACTVRAPNHTLSRSLPGSQPRLSLGCGGARAYTQPINALRNGPVRLRACSLLSSSLVNGCV